MWDKGRKSAEGVLVAAQALEGEVAGALVAGDDQTDEPPERQG